MGANIQNTDGPYPQEKLVRDPHDSDGRLLPAAEILDDAHATLRQQEIIRQHEAATPETIVIPNNELPGRAGALLTSLYNTVSLWEAVQETRDTDGRIVKDYHTTLEDLLDTRQKTFISVQLVYRSAEDTQPVYGNAAIIKPVEGQKWPREFYFQVDPGSNEEKNPLIYYVDYPYHEEDLGQPERNTEAAATGARDIIAQIPKTI